MKFYIRAAFGFLAIPDKTGPSYDQFLLPYKSVLIPASHSFLITALISDLLIKKLLFQGFHQASRDTLSNKMTAVVVF